ncbi:globin domain-containing protein [Ruegeria sp. TrichCH4B]|uniref:globin domain-containing protein n=1 Tax=Tritonibacter mobilis TaxID=379347 RepID=UPI0001B8A312|nr:hypothetical protein SCH4B_0097 [Ruegeria sp. TrichCH4B]
MEKIPSGGEKKPRTKVKVLNISSRDIDLLQSSCATAFLKKGVLASAFYNKLFEIEPAYVNKFSNINKQKIMFEAMLAYCISGITSGYKVEALTARLRSYHMHLEISDIDIANARSALMYALGSVLGEDFHSDLKQAWDAAFSSVSEALRS